MSRLNRGGRVTLRERLEQLVRSAPRGTLIPVEGLAELIGDAEDTQSTDLAVEDVGRLAAERFGRRLPYKPAAIRRWIRTGLRGVRLPAYPSGIGYRVTANDFERFVAQVRALKSIRPPHENPVAASEELDPEEELRIGAGAYAANRR